MKNYKVGRLVALALALMLLFAVVGCKTNGNVKSTDDPGSTATSAPAPAESLSDVPADRYDATVTPRTGNNATEPLVLSTSTLDGKFSPFFYTSAYDNNVITATQIGLLATDKNGEPMAGIEWPCLAYSFTQEAAADNSSTTYKFILKNGITFSDGEPVTIKDVLFNYYMYLDPAYDGISTLYSQKIQGLNEYRLQTSPEMLDLANKILEAGIEGEAGEPVYPAAAGVTPEQQATFWGYMDEAGAAFAQEIVDYVVANYNNDDYAPEIGKTPDEIKADPSLQVAFGMVMWGFGSVEGDVLTDALENTYTLGTDELTAEIYWQNILGSYGYDIDLNDAEAGLNYEKAGDITIETRVRDLFIKNEGAVAGGVADISGITSGKEVCADGVERDFIQIVIDGIDPVAIFQLGITIAPFHYYTGGYTGTLNANGVETGSKEFMDFVKSKNDKPVGAGPYIFESFQDGVVTYTANDSFMLGSPKIKTLRYQEITMGAEMDALTTGTVHFSDPSASTTIINNVTGGEGDFGKLSYTLVDNDGYGYVKMQGQAIPEFKVRQAIAHALNVQLCIDDYYGELASPNYRTMTKVQWAYPDNPEQIYPYDGTGETSKGLFLECGYIYDEAANIMYYPEEHEKAGTQVTFKFSLPSDASEHPAGTVFVDTQEVLGKIGVKVDIETDAQLLSKLNTAYENGLQVWAAAWGSGGVDPDMFQIWYSDPTVNQGNSPRSGGLYYLFTDGSEEEKAMLTELNELIMAGRATLDPEERKPIYARALEISSSLAIEIPTYQRKNMFVFNKDVINAATLFSGDDVTPFRNPTDYLWNIELN